jgi:hypothetical protein
MKLNPNILPVQGSLEQYRETQHLPRFEGNHGEQTNQRIYNTQVEEFSGLFNKPWE